MAFIRNFFVAALLIFCIGSAKAQTVYYPAQSSRLLRSTAEDLAMLLRKAMPGSQWAITTYTALPATGIIFIYDPAVEGAQSCKTESDGSTYITFRAAQDNALIFGVYEYLRERGFRFYQPGSIWEIIPTLNSPYKKINTVYACNYQYKSWFISGGCNRWIMDDNNNYGWDTYFGENGHNWALYQRRNGMTGAYHFAGHRGDIMTGTYLNTLQSNPCYVACYNGSRQANAQSVPDINNYNAKALWSNSIEQQFTSFKNTIYGNPELYADYYYNFDYRYSHIGIEVPDGAQWGNSKDNGICGAVVYPAASDQHFMIANFTAQQLNASYPGKRLQLYAYSTHADVPSANIGISNTIDVQVVPTAFQNETSAKGLLNRWYNTTHTVSEYHYLNIPQWGGETPMFYLDDMKATLDRIKEKNSQGIMWEASPAKFATLPFLLAANSNLKDNIAVDSSLHYFCNDMFATAANSIYTLLHLWSDDKTITTGDFIQDNKYKLPLYLKLLDDADRQTQNDPAVVRERIRELKAYLHYMVLYYDWLFDQRPHAQKTAKAAALCMYLAKINKLQIVNSYFLVADIVSHYPTTDNFFQQYNTTNGTAYQNGNLPLIKSEEIENNFRQDMAAMGDLIDQYKLTAASLIKEQMANTDLSPLKKINVKILYTNGYDYPNRSEFFIDAPAAGNFSIAYTPHFNMPGKGYINFTVEATGKALQVIKDLSIDNNAAPGTLNISLPSAGVYKLSVVSKYQSAVDLAITTNGNYFYKNGPFLGNKTENYRNDLLSLPGYFYVPPGLHKVYFSINNSNPGGSGHATAEAISKAFVIKDNSGSTLQPRLVTSKDSALFYLEVPPGGSGVFWQVQKMEQYNLCFSNISNVQWYAQRNSACSNANFTVSVLNTNGNCVTQLTAATDPGNLKWEVYDQGRVLTFEKQAVVQLPDYTSPNAVVILNSGSNCSVSKHLADDKNYLKAREACASGASLPINDTKPILYPNPSTGIFNCLQNDAVLTANEILIINAQGLRIGYFKDVKQFSIHNAPAGIYWYKMLVKGSTFTGKLVKL